MNEVTVNTDKATMWGQAGTSFLIGEETVEVDRPGILVADCCLNDVADIGKGYGKELYQHALAQYGTIYSIYPVEESEMQVQHSLIRRGVARREYVNDDYGIIALIAN